jgi:sugar O-acyltransferase (sialic acid O-acetyltransferase NeuD family)
MLLKLVIAGAGGFGREVVAWARQSLQWEREWSLKGVIDDNPRALVGMNTPAPWIGTICDYQPSSDEVFLCALGVPSIKRQVTELLLSRGARFTRLVHRSAVIGDNVELADGVILCPFAAVTANNRLGRGVVINVHASVDHDANVGDWSQVNCHCDLTASVQVGREVFLGSSVSVIPNVRIGDNAYIGAGAVVLQDVCAGARMVGVPARAIKGNVSLDKRDVR